MMSKMCCLDLGLTIAARFIGAVGLIVSVIVMCELATEMALHEGRGKIAVILGVDVDQFYIDSSNTAELSGKERAQPNYCLVVLFLFAVANLLASSLLIWATILEKRVYTVPWFLCQATSFLVQVVGFAHYVNNKDNLEDDVAIASFANLVITMYFWCTVFRAQENWIKVMPERNYLRIQSNHTIISRNEATNLP
ncbi:uncharacterized protein [Periplaneta americana]|uniref:uncharacterized protein n=1 Tax=Periplaneta americana TaxID=6978 RepID=UPI0037E83942